MSEFKSEDRGCKRERRRTRAAVWPNWGSSCWEVSTAGGDSIIYLPESKRLLCEKEDEKRISRLKHYGVLGTRRAKGRRPSKPTTAERSALLQPGTFYMIDFELIPFASTLGRSRP